MEISGVTTPSVRVHRKRRGNGSLCTAVNIRTPLVKPRAEHDGASRDFIEGAVPVSHKNGQEAHKHVHKDGDVTNSLGTQQNKDTRTSDIFSCFRRQQCCNLKM